MTIRKEDALRHAHDQHRELRLELRVIAERVEKISNPPATAAEGDEIRARIARFATELDTHFGCEEELGFVSAAIEEAPRLSRRAAALSAEHGGLRSQIARIRTLADDPQWSAEDTRQALQRFVLDFCHHEERENRLISEALFEDLGGPG